MPIVVEDGTGLSNAVSYVSIAYVTAHHAARGRTDWAALNDEEMEQCCVRATDYIEQRFGDRFVGYKASSDQSLLWPRVSAISSDGFSLTGVPAALQMATAEYALIAWREGELAPNPARTTPDEAVADGASTEDPVGEVVRERVGPIETEYRPISLGHSTPAARRATQSSQVSDYYLPQYPRADLWIESLLRSSISGRLVRA